MDDEDIIRMLTAELLIGRRDDRWGFGGLIRALSAGDEGSYLS